METVTVAERGQDIFTDLLCMCIFHFRPRDVNVAQSNRRCIKVIFIIVVCNME